MILNGHKWKNSHEDDENNGRIKRAINLLVGDMVMLPFNPIPLEVETIDTFSRTIVVNLGRGPLELILNKDQWVTLYQPTEYYRPKHLANFDPLIDD